MPRQINVTLEMYCVHRPRYAAAAGGACCGKADAILFQSVYNELVHKEGMAYINRVGRAAIMYEWWPDGRQ